VGETERDEIEACYIFNEHFSEEEREREKSEARDGKENFSSFWHFPFFLSCSLLKFYAPIEIFV
jgi:hypothetical protein